MTSQTSTRVLVVDDDADDLELFAEAVHKLDPAAGVHTTLSGTGALRYLEQCHETELPHFIVLDFNIPDIKGSEILEQIRNHAKVQHIPVYIWSTSNSPYLKTECLEKGAKAFFVKPVIYNDLLAIVQQLLAAVSKPVFSSH